MLGIILRNTWYKELQLKAQKKFNIYILKLILNV